MVRSVPVLRILSIGLLAVYLAAIPGNASEPTVILISLDGTTPAQVRSAKLPTLGRMGRDGAIAARLIPVFPSNTFPNHVSLVTGVAPERHGIVNNVFLDPERGVFSYEHDPSWLEVEPIWSLAARHGVVSASYYWVGSEGPWTSGLGPRHWKTFSSKTSEGAKVEQILAWLDLADSAERPRLITSWFHGADSAGHRYGPGSARVRTALRKQDAAFAELVAGLEERKRLESTTLIVVSDHGMAPVAQQVDLADALRSEGLAARVFGGGGFVTVKLRDYGAERAVDRAVDRERAVAVAERLGLHAYAVDQAPSAWRVDNPRFGDLVVMASVGSAISKTGWTARLGQIIKGRGSELRGAHGYLPSDPAMGAILIAMGRGVRPETRLGEVRAIDVAPTILKLLGVPVPSWMEGKPIDGIGEPVGIAEVSSPKRELR